MTNKLLKRASIAGFAMLFSLSTAACSHASQPPHEEPPAKAAATPVTEAPQSNEQESVEDRMVLATSKAIRQAHLTSLKDECLAYNFEPNAFQDAYLVEVRENHRHAGCGGDPQTQPRLFSVKIDKNTQKMWTDQGTPGQFHPLQPAR